jgi:hypothetical protein
LQSEFWGELASSHPAIEKLHATGQLIEDDLMQADKLFLKMLALNPSSVLTLRRYANFLGEVRDCQCFVLVTVVRALEVLQHSIGTGMSDIAMP